MDRLYYLKRNFKQMWKLGVDGNHDLLVIKIYFLIKWKNSKYIVIY